MVVKCFYEISCSGFFKNAVNSHNKKVSQYSPIKFRDRILNEKRTVTGH